MSDSPIPDDKHHQGLPRDQVDSLKTQYQNNADDHGWSVNFKETDEGNGKWTLDVIYKRPAGPAAAAAVVVASTASVTGGTAPVQAQLPVEAASEKLVADREGRRNDVYPDKLKKPTVGIGHLVVAADSLKLGDIISDERVTALFSKDSAEALGAARKQVVAAGISDAAFLPYLASVNFQLGTAWTDTFPNTWKMIVNGEYENAAKALDGTLWAQQTPVRVRDFQDALRRLPAKH
jgi:GH24 family phage-related lysozyme (muramidase)